MAKKNKTAQRTKEEQWRRRMQQQAGRPTGTTYTAGAVDEYDLDADTAADVFVAETEERIIPTSTRTSTVSRNTQTRTPASAATPRRAAAPQRTTRPRLGGTTLTLEEEMHYVRADIRSLVILTVLCFVVLIALTFVIR